MLDSDLAKLYKVETKRINEAVRNNPEKFPERFSWKLTDQESQIFLVENFDQKIETRGGKYKNPRVFTEQGVAMLATILNSDIATKVSIAIMDAFVSMRHYLMQNKDIYQSIVNINNRLDKHDIKLIEHEVKLDDLFDSFNQKLHKEYIYFNGQIYDAYSKVLDLMKEAKSELIIIDGYADKSVLDMISKINVKVILVVKIKSLLSKLDIEKYNKQYNNLKVVYSDTYHDRYIILDNKKVYHLGASINHLGSKTFSINTISDERIIKLLVDNVSLLV